MTRVLYFCEREHDLAQMTVYEKDGVLRSRRRREGDVVAGQPMPPRFGDCWIHVKSQGRYVRIDPVIDDESGEDSYTYVSDAGRFWQRSVKEWHEVSNGTARFEPLQAIGAR